MQPNTQEAPGYFVWQPAGKPYSVHIALDVVDRLNAEVMRGFGAVPKRGAEVGGVLLGSVERGENTVVRVDDFEMVACEYRRGPSYYLTEEEQEALGAAARSERAVGYYRSHTRDGAMALGTEDLDWLARLFAENSVALLVKPFATKVNAAGFFVQEDGAYPAQTPLEFPFRRREMLGEEAPPRRSMYERKPRSRERREQSYEPAAPEYDYAESYSPEPGYTEEYVAPRPKKQRSAWMWMPLALIFLGLGAALGYQVALRFASGLRGHQDASTFALSLSAEPAGESVTVRWNREAPAILAAQRGTLEITDGDLTQELKLAKADLTAGSVVYQNTSPTVRFRLVIVVSPSATVNEVVDWRK